MIARISTQVGFTDLARYLEQDKNDPEKSRASHVWTQHLYRVSSPKLAAEIMADTASLNRKVEQPVVHMTVSWGTDEKPSFQQMEAVARRMLSDLGLDKNEALLVAHTDRDHPHFHLMVNRVELLTRKAWSQHFSYARVEKSLRQIEAEMGFRVVPGHHAPTPDGQYADRSRSLPAGARRMELRDAEKAAASNRQPRESFITRTRADARSDFEWATSWRDLEVRLRKNGLRLERLGTGLAVTDGIHGAGVSRIASNASLAKLEDRFGIPFDRFAQSRGEATRRDTPAQERSDFDI